MDIPKEAYSMEDAKLRSGVDAKRVTAEDLKGKVRRSIEALRKEYKEAVNMNDALPTEVTRRIFTYTPFFLI